MTVEQFKSTAQPIRSKTPATFDFNSPIVNRKFLRSGLTLVEIMLATAVLVIAVLGASAFRYHAALDARRADLQATAARAALLLCESWRGSSDPNTFDPTLLAITDPNSPLAIETVSEGPAGPTDFTLLGTYRITLDGVNYYAVLSWKDVYTGLRALNVIVAWDQRGSGASGFGDVNKLFKLTTYVAN